MRKCSRPDHRSARPSVYTTFSANGAGERASPSRRLSMSRAHCGEQAGQARRGYLLLGAAPPEPAQRRCGRTWRSVDSMAGDDLQTKSLQMLSRSASPSTRTPSDADVPSSAARHRIGPRVTRRAAQHGGTPRRTLRALCCTRSTGTAAGGRTADSSICGAHTDATRGAHDGTQLWQVKRVWRGERIGSS